MAWNIDTSHSEIGFVARHMVVSKVRGQFLKWSGTVDVPGDDFSKLSTKVEIDAASINTREEKRDGHLRSADFFDTERFPKITFESTRVEKSGETYKLVGALSMHGVTKEVSLDVTFLGKGKDPWGGTRAGFSAKGTVNRTDWDLKWNQALELGGVLVGEKIDIEIEVQLTQS